MHHRRRELSLLYSSESGFADTMDLFRLERAHSGDTHFAELFIHFGVSNAMSRLTNIPPSFPCIRVATSEHKDHMYRRTHSYVPFQRDRTSCSCQLANC